MTPFARIIKIIQALSSWKRYLQPGYSKNIKTPISFLISTKSVTRRPVQCADSRQAQSHCSAGVTACEIVMVAGLGSAAPLQSCSLSSNTGICATASRAYARTVAERRIGRRLYLFAVVKARAIRRIMSDLRAVRRAICTYIDQR